MLSTTDATSVTTDRMDMASSSNDDETDDGDKHSANGPMAKLLADSTAMTSSTIDEMNEMSTATAAAVPALATTQSESDSRTSNESTTTSAVGKSDTFLDASNDSGPAKTDESRHSEDATDAPVHAHEADEEETKPTLKPSAIDAHPIKLNDRSRVVSKTDIESIRGRAINFTGSDRRPMAGAGGVIYVTAPPPQSAPFDAVAADGPPAMVMPKSAKSNIFSDDLSDVSMENDGMELHSSEHMAMIKMMTTTPTTTPKASAMKANAPSTVHDPKCQSKVRSLF